MTMTVENPVTAPTIEAITLPYSVAMLNGLYAVALHASKDDMTPVICAVRVSATTFLATDRYTVGEWRHAAEDAIESDFAVIIPRATAEWLTKQLPKALGTTEGYLTATESRPGAVIMFTPDSVTVIGPDGETLAVTRFAPISGNFPPVARLLEGAGPADDATPVNLSPALLEHFTKGALKVDKKAPFTIALSKTTNPSKPGPVIVKFAAFRGLIQPSLLR